MMLIFAGLFVLNLLLRVFYIRYDFVNGDEGVRALTAVRMLEGARLYADVVTDKPPGASLFYAAVFTMFGRSMQAVHLAATVWNFGTALVVYLIAARFYERRVGLIAALLFVYFSTNYFTQDMMAANTELLMALPYTAAFYFFLVASSPRKLSNGDDVLPDFMALVFVGMLTGIAAMFKQIGVLNLLFFFSYEVVVVWAGHGTRRNQRGMLVKSIRRVVWRLSLVAVGFVLVIGGFLLWLNSIGALHDFWRNGVVLNMFYIDSVPPGSWIKFMLGRGLGYLFFNAILWFLAVLAVWKSVDDLRNDRLDDSRARLDRYDLAVALWGGVTLIAVVMSGRFYGHYFIPALPALSLLGARGWRLFIQFLRMPEKRISKRVLVAVMSLLFLIGLFRCHHRTAVLAFETLTGTRTQWSANWGMTKREQEAQVVSDYVREKIPPGEPLYIWGYAHDVYWRTRCRPACRYLTPYYIDGRFSDAEATVPASGEVFRREAAANLIEDLRRNKPILILDVEGSFRSLPFAELLDFVDAHYREVGSIGIEPGHPFRVLELRSAP